MAVLRFGRAGDVKAFQLSGWPYRLPVVVEETGGLDHTDKCIVIDLKDLDFPFSDVAFEDGHDIRVTDSDGETIIPCYRAIFSKSNGIGVLIVKLPSLKAYEKKQIYIYYGNPDAEPYNDTSLFDFFDDFEDGDYTDKWVVEEGEFAEENGVMKQVSDDPDQSNSGTQRITSIFEKNYQGKFIMVIDQKSSPTSESWETDTYGGMDEDAVIDDNPRNMKYKMWTNPHGTYPHLSICGVGDSNGIETGRWYRGIAWVQAEHGAKGWIYRLDDYYECYRAQRNTADMSKDAPIKWGLHSDYPTEWDNVGCAEAVVPEPKIYSGEAPTPPPPTEDVYTNVVTVTWGAAVPTEMFFNLIWLVLVLLIMFMVLSIIASVIRS